jgi:hypothetical protein
VGLTTPDWLPNLYTSGRRIGDEYRYILERRYAAKFPGNLLSRPGLILNPWELRTTESGTSALTATEAPQAMAGAVEGLSRNAALKHEVSERVAPEPESSLDFLARPAPGLFNLRPDTNGVVRIPIEELGDQQTGVGLAAQGLLILRKHQQTLARGVDQGRLCLRAPQLINKLHRDGPLAIQPLLVVPAQDRELIAIENNPVRAVEPKPLEDGNARKPDGSSWLTRERSLRSEERTIGDQAVRHRPRHAGRRSRARAFVCRTKVTGTTHSGEVSRNDAAATRDRDLDGARCGLTSTPDVDIMNSDSSPYLYHIRHDLRGFTRVDEGLIGSKG